VWTNEDGHVEFVGGTTGRNVHVRGVSPGNAELKAIIGGRELAAPTLPVKVVEPQPPIKITAWIVENESNKQARKIEDVQDMIAPLNDIYRQVGVSFYLDSVIVTNIPAAYNLLYSSETNGVWNRGRLLDIGRNTGGIECYFVNGFIMEDDSEPPLAVCNPRGITLSAQTDVVTLAHEIGHAFGLRDVFVANMGLGESIPPGDEKSVEGQKMRRACSEHDWNGGCRGHGDGGCRYYPVGTRLSTLLCRLLMYGVEMSEIPSGTDITWGYVTGVWRMEQEGVTTWCDDNAPVGFFYNMFKETSPNSE
jgi:hypothetical protein